MAVQVVDFPFGEEHAVINYPNNINVVTIIIPFAFEKQNNSVGNIEFYLVCDASE